MTVITRTETERGLPVGALPVAEWGLLSRVERPCPGSRRRVRVRRARRGRRMPGVLVRARGAPLHTGRPLQAGTMRCLGPSDVVAGRYELIRALGGGARGASSWPATATSPARWCCAWSSRATPRRPRRSSTRAA